MKNTWKISVISAMVVIFCIVMAITDGVLQVNYFIKSAIKIVMFLCIPAMYALIDKELNIKKLFVINKRSAVFSLFLGIVVYIIIISGYFLLKDFFDFSSITSSLTENAGVSRSNFVFVSIYISFVNSLLEEFFFRGFAFLTLKRLSGRRYAYIFSATSFALYHIAMMKGWFSIPLLVLVLAGLFAGGIIFNYLNEKSNSIYPSWLVHMFANFSINTIGFLLFGIIKF